MAEIEASMEQEGGVADDGRGLTAVNMEKRMLK